MTRSTSGPTPDPGRPSRRARAGLVVLGVLVASTLVPGVVSVRATAADAADQVTPAGVTSDSPEPPAAPGSAVGAANRAPCKAAGGAHCLAIVNSSDKLIKSWLLKVFNADTNMYDPVSCLSVPGDRSTGTTFFPDVHLNEGQLFLLDGYRDSKSCRSLNNWAGQGFTMGGADSDNYSFAEFTANKP